MKHKEMIALLLAGGQGSRLGILTKNKAKPAVSFGGKYKIIDFPMSNCVNSGIDTVGVLTQYQPLELNRHIGIGIPWDLDKQYGGVTVLAPHVKDGEEGHWYSGTANAIYQNIKYIDNYNPEYVLIISGDHIYKMNYNQMLNFHKESNAAATIAVLEVEYSEAHRFGIMNTKENGEIFEFEEKPKQPKNNLASMGIYIFTWDKLRKILLKSNEMHKDLDFGKHIIPIYLKNNYSLYAYKFNEYWKDVGTIDSYYNANMELIKNIPEFNLYEDFSKIYTQSDHQAPQFTGIDADIKTSIISEGAEVYGSVYNSILGGEVIIYEGAIIRDSIIMGKTIVKNNSIIERCIIDESCIIGENTKIGMGDNIANKLKPDIYNTGITVIGQDSFIPDNIIIGKNCVIHGNTKNDDYYNNRLESGETIDFEALSYNVSDLAEAIL